MIIHTKYCYFNGVCR